MTVYRNDPEFFFLEGLIAEKSAYSRMLQLEAKIFSDDKYKDSPLVSFIALWVYAEYFAEYSQEGMRDRLFRLPDILKALEKTAFEGGFHSGGVLQYGATSATIILPRLSAKAWDCLYQNVSGIRYLTMQNNQVSFSPAGKARWTMCQSPTEILSFWTLISGKIREIEGPLDRNGLRKLFKTYCLEAVGVGKLLYSSATLSPKGMQFWNSLQQNEPSVSAFRQAYLQDMPDNNASIVRSMIFHEASDSISSSFIDLAMVLEAGAFKQFVERHGDLKLKMTEQVYNVLTFNNQVQLSFEEKRRLIVQAGFLLSQFQLSYLATDYVAIDWRMFRAVRREALLPSRGWPSTLNFDNTEKMATAGAKASWPEYFKKLEGIVSWMETGSTYSYLQGFLNPMSVLSATSNFPQDLKLLLDPEGINVDMAGKTYSDALKQFITDWSQDNPDCLTIRAEDLPVMLQEKLRKLQPAPAQVASRAEFLRLKG